MKFPIERHDPFIPPPEYRILAGNKDPIEIQLEYGGSAWLVTDHTVACAILRDTTFSSDSTRDDYPLFPLATRRKIPGHFLSLDPPEHSRLRSAVLPEFTRSRIESYRPRLSIIIDELLDEMVARGSPCDLISQFAAPIPSLTICALLGISVDNRSFFSQQVKILQLHDSRTTQRVAAAGRIRNVLRSELIAKTESPEDDILSRLALGLSSSSSPDTDLEEVVGIANLLLVAGLETTASLIGLTTLSLLRDPEQSRLLATAPSRWCSLAVRESLRYWSLIQHGVARVATRDVCISGHLYRRGDAVVVHLPSANRDGCAFSNPDIFDMRRDATKHLAFGHGPHRCLGSVLAEMEAEMAINKLFSRLSGLQLSESLRRLRFGHEMLVFGLESLSVEW